MATITRFEELEAWQTARELTRKVYEFTKQGEFARDFSLCDQMRRASVSIMSNIAERFESRIQSLFIDYLGRAKASCGELRAQFYVVNDIGYLTKEDFAHIYDLCDKCSRQLSRFMQYLHHQPKSIREEGIEYNV